MGNQSAECGDWERPLPSANRSATFAKLEFRRATKLPLRDGTLVMEMLGRRGMGGVLVLTGATGAEEEAGRSSLVVCVVSPFGSPTDEDDGEETPPPVVPPRGWRKPRCAAREGMEHEYAACV